MRGRMSDLMASFAYLSRIGPLWRSAIQWHPTGAPADPDQDILDKGDKVIIIDARHSLGGEILKGAIHVPSDKLDDWAKNADKTAVIVTYCTCPHDEAADAEMLKLLQMGFKNAYSLTGGMDAARAAGIEIVAPADK